MIDKLRKLVSPAVQADAPLAPFTTFRVGGSAEYYLEATDGEQVAAAVKACQELAIPLYVFGGGSNLLINDEGIKGLVLRMANQQVVVDGAAVIAGAGTASGALARQSAEAGLAGLEWMIGLPGTVGGAVRGNAGMFGGDVADNLDSVLVVTPAGEPKTMSAAECELAYRDSVFKRLPGTIIVSARFALEPTDKAACLQKMQGFLAKKAAEQPVDGHTAGCMFKNWKPASEEEIATVRRALDLNKDEEVPFTATGAVPAGWIIDRAQLKGMKVGHCRVSEKHGNFIINDGEGTASEILALSSAVKMKVRDMTHGLVMFEDEIQYAGY
jgi:UDP-N-acetylmuramate dehydrogenase